MSADMYQWQKKDEGRRFVDFICDRLESTSKSQKEVKVLHLDKALVKQQIIILQRAN